MNELRRQWVQAFSENGIHTVAQSDAGMVQARRQATPFLPSPSQFIAWCKQGAIRASGLPDDNALYEMVMNYSAHRGLYDTPGIYPWQSNTCYWIVTKLYSEMHWLKLTEAELRKRCIKELSAMSKRIEAEEPVPAPVVQISKLHIPQSNTKGLDKIAELRAKLNMPGKER